MHDWLTDEERDESCSGMLHCRGAPWVEALLFTAALVLAALL